MGPIRHQDWHAIVAIVAAAAALMLHLFHVIDEDAVLAIILFVLGLLLLESVRQGAWQERLEVSVSSARSDLAHLMASAEAPDTVLVGPGQLRSRSAAFAAGARGEMAWFNVCLLMFRPQVLFDAMLRPAMENPAVTAIRFVLDESERDHWRLEVAPKVAACRGAEKVLEPHWVELDEAVSFIVCEQVQSGKVEAHLSFWGEPFMSRTGGRDVPRYVLHVQPHSPLLPHLVDMERRYRLGS
jgi:hypothetical protein